MQTENTAFNVVFEGRYVDGRDPVVAQTAFAERYGDSVAGQVFSQKRAVLKRNVTQDDALQMQGVLAEVGVMVSLTPAVDAAAPPKRKAKGAVSIVERAAQRSRARKGLTPANEAVIPDAPVTQEPSVQSVPTPASVEEVATAAPEPEAAPVKSRTLLWMVLAVVLLLPLLYFGFTIFTGKSPLEFLSIA